MQIAKQKRKIAIGTITRNRPQMLKQLLNSYTNMDFPENCDISFIIVENNDVPTINDIINEFKLTVPQHDIVYRVEPRLGIASARDHVLGYAIDNHFDLLTFADDDETVDRLWLTELLKERDAHDLDLVGSPVRPAPVDPSFSWWQKTIWHAINTNNHESEKRFIKKCANGQAGQLRIATGSWMGNLDFFRRTNIRFNTELGLAGGEDWHLYDEAKTMGAKTGWTPHAIAEETIPAARLCLRYYYRRDRDHARMVSYARCKKNAIQSAIRITGSVASRFYKAVFALCMVPFAPGKAMMKCTYHVGSTVGLIQGHFGMKSAHYENVSGH